MREVLHKITTIVMALLLLLSTVSWKVEKHYCMGRLMNVALFRDVDTCGMDMSLLMDSENLGEAQNSCCNDDVVFVEGQDDLKISFNDLDIEQQYYVVALAQSYCNLFLNLKELPVPSEQYPPPLLVKNIQLLDEVFLI